MNAGQSYLALYNVVQALGWAYCLACLAWGVSQGAGPASLYAMAGPCTKLFQGLSLLEVLHAATGLVPSSPAAALMQWAGRSNVLFAVLDALRPLHDSWWAVSMMAAWSAAEVVRYPWYAASIAGVCPGWLTWLRYSAFLPLYPVGVVSEMALLVLALPHLKALRLYSIGLPNAANFAFSYHAFIMILLAFYPLLWWQLYSTLLRARAKKLGGGGGGASSARSSKGAKGS